MTRRCTVSFLRSATMELTDGRTLSWAELGLESSRHVLIANHGGGSSRLELAFHDEALAGLGLRVLAPERPGYGRSTALGRGRSVADWARDVSQLVDEVGVAKFAVSGYSGGGPHALAIAASAELAARVTHVILSAAFAPGQPHRTSRDAEIEQRAGRMPWQEFEDWFVSVAEEGPNLTPADKEAFADGAYLGAAQAAFAEGAAQGLRGNAGDRWALATPWGFELSAVEQPVDIWHGAADSVVPVSHAHALGRALPESTTHILDSDGHFSIGRLVPEVVAVAATVARG